MDIQTPACSNKANDDGGLDQDGSSGGCEKWSDSGISFEGGTCRIF